MTKAEIIAAFKAETEVLLKAQSKLSLKYGLLYAKAHADETPGKVDDAIVGVGAPVLEAALGQMIDDFKL